MQVGDIVHYVSHGTPPREDGTQAYPSVCRAAIIADNGHAYGRWAGTEPQEPDHQDVALVVLNPTGMFFNEHVDYDAGHAPGTWHHKCGN